MDEETTGNPVFLTLGTAARTAGMSKSTISKAIRTGKLSAERNPDTNSFRIHVAELDRYLSAHNVVRGNVAAERSDTPKEPPDVAVATRLAVAEAQVGELRAMVAHLTAEVDRWHAQAERLSLPGPQPERGGWRRWWRRAG